MAPPLEDRKEPRRFLRNAPHLLGAETGGWPYAAAVIKLEIPSWADGGAD